MIKNLTLLILGFLDFFHKKKILNFLVKSNLPIINIFFDIGAHKGETIIFFGKNLKLKKIYSFEASPLTYKILLNNLRRIKRKLPKIDIKLENIALGSSNNKIKIKHFNESSSSTIKDINTYSNYFKKKKNFLFGIGKSNYYKEVSIKQTTIDDYMFLNKIKEIDLLKIDAEGSEYEIVKGCFKNLKNIKIILFEHHYDDMIFKGYKFKDINDFLLQNNFKQIFKIKMPLRKTFEYIYKNKAY